MESSNNPPPNPANLKPAAAIIKEASLLHKKRERSLTNILIATLVALNVVLITQQYSIIRGQGELKADLKTEIAAVQTEVAVIKTEIAFIKTEVAVIKTEVAVIKTELDEVKDDVSWLKGAVLPLLPQKALPPKKVSASKKQAGAPAGLSQAKAPVSVATP